MDTAPIATPWMNATAIGRYIGKGVVLCFEKLRPAGYVRPGSAGIV